MKGSVEVEIGKPEMVFFHNKEYCDKGPNIQFRGLTVDQKNEITDFVLYNDNFKEGLPFKQGDQGDWLMIEFHNKDERLISSYARKIAFSMKFLYSIIID